MIIGDCGEATEFIQSRWMIKIMAADKSLVLGHIHPLMNEWCTWLGHLVCIALENHLFNEKHPQ
jgi:hypothetical protein